VEQLFKVLGELKGGAMKTGQAMSMYEAALPPELAAPFRAALTRLQEAAPPLPATVMHGVLAESLGENWRDLFLGFDDPPAASASIGSGPQGRLGRRPHSGGQAAVPRDREGDQVRPQGAALALQALRDAGTGAHCRRFPEGADRAGLLLFRFNFSALHRCGLILA
jgi:hypothetical protein